MRKRHKLKHRSEHFVDAETASRARWTAVMTHIQPPTLGSLWWVEESLWKDRIRRYDQKSTRHGHPGLSAMRYPITDLFSQVPLFHGTSGRSGPVVASGLDPDKPADYSTAFGRLVATVAVNEWTPLGGEPRVCANLHKTRLDQTEQADFDAFLKRRKLA